MFPANLRQLDHWENDTNTSVSNVSSISTKGLNKESVLVKKAYLNMIEANKGIDAGEVEGQHWTRGPSYDVNKVSKVCFTSRRYPE